VFIGSLLTPAMLYSSSAMIRVSDGIVMPAQAVAASQHTDVAAMNSPMFIASMAAKTGVPAATITANWRVDPIPGSQLIRSWYTCPSAKEASTMANAMVAYGPNLVIGVGTPTGQLTVGTAAGGTIS